MNARATQTVKRMDRVVIEITLMMKVMSNNTQKLTVLMEITMTLHCPVANY